MDQVIFFCQAPADLQYILSEYNRGKFKNVIIVVTNNLTVYNFIKSLNLVIDDLVFVPYRNFSHLFNPFYLLQEKNNLRNLNNKYFKNKIGYTIYFYSIGYDWISFYFIRKLIKRNSVFYVDYGTPPIDLLNNISLYQKSIQIVVKLITGMWFPFGQNEIMKNVFLYFDYTKYGILKTAPYVDKEALIRYSYKEKKIITPSVLLLESNMETYDFHIDYRKDIIHVLNLLKKYGFYIYVKPHPRCGYSPFIGSYVNCFIPKEIPSEFFDVSDFQMVLKMESISNFACDNNNVFSIIELFKFKDEEIKIGFRNKLKELDINSLKFIENETEFIQLMEEAKG